MSIETLPAEIEAPEDDEQVEEEDVWRPYRNRAARRRFVKQWQRQESSRQRRGRSAKPGKRVLKVSEWLSGSR